MIQIEIPSYKDIQIENVVFDYNGTLATDGIVDNNIKNKLEIIQKKVDVYVLTADTYGNVEKNLADTKLKVHIISKENGTDDKVNFIRKLGSSTCIAIGNGNNDKLMIKEAEIGICVIGDEGCSTKTLINSQIVVKNINDCVDLLLNTDRLIATLRG